MSLQEKRKKKSLSTILWVTTDGPEAISAGAPAVPNGLMDTGKMDTGNADKILELLSYI